LLRSWCVKMHKIEFLFSLLVEPDPSSRGGGEGKGRGGGINGCPLQKSCGRPWSVFAYLHCMAFLNEPFIRRDLLWVGAADEDRYRYTRRVLHGHRSNNRCGAMFLLEKCCAERDRDTRCSIAGQDGCLKRHPPPTDRAARPAGRDVQQFIAFKD